MKRIGLALSGGGWRAAIYHLGVIRFFRDAQLLPHISHITCVSGGSVTGAHLALNWDRYCGSASEFEQAASEIIDFVQLDVRNRIVRRFPLTSLANTVARICRLPIRRQFTRPGLLESHYEKFLYGDTSLFQLPDSPRLHILSTNLSEGCLCSFYQGGLLLQRRAAGRADLFERVNFGLATVPMAVAASSAFPGFFPPLEMSGWEVGTQEGEFNRQSFTDGGVIDNLGLRMFRFIEESWIRDITPLSSDDVLEPEAVMSAFRTAGSQPEGSPLHRLWQKMGLPRQALGGEADSSQAEFTIEKLSRSLWEVISASEIYHDPAFEGLTLEDSSAQSLLDYVRASRHKLELGDRLWLNRQLVDAALEQVSGMSCLRVKREGFDNILVSDAGAIFKVAAEGRAGGIISTAMRSSDIAMDRVYQLELEAFRNSDRAIFMPMADVVTPTQNPQAPHPEIQRQAARIRTDMDRFTELEVSALVQHGYCVARKNCQNLLNQLGMDMPAGPPWNPFADESADPMRLPAHGDRLSDDREALATARLLRQSSKRRVWRTLLSFRDWPSYFWAPLLACIMLSVPYSLYKANKTAQQQNLVLSAIAETSPVYRRILELLNQGPGESLGAADYEDVQTLESPDFTGYEIVSDNRIIDLRGWADPRDTSTPPFLHARIRVRRTLESGKNTHLRFQLDSPDEVSNLHCRSESLKPKLSRMRSEGGRYLWELDLDFSHVPVGGDAQVVMESDASTEMASHTADGGSFLFSVPFSTGLAQIWMLMPAGRKYEYFEISGYPTDHPELTKLVVPSTKVELPIGSIATFQLINPQENYRYECRWKWAETE